MVSIGLASLAAAARGPAVATALALAAVIGAYTVVDSHGARESTVATYELGDFLADAVGATIVLTATRRWRVAGRVLRTSPTVCAGTAVAALAAYALVMAAVRQAPVGYVTARFGSCWSRAPSPAGRCSTNHRAPPVFRLRHRRPLRPRPPHRRRLAEQPRPSQPVRRRRTSATSAARRSPSARASSAATACRWATVSASRSRTNCETDT